MSSEVWINNTRIDVTQEEIYAFTYKIADLRMPETRNTSFSKTVKVPGSKINDQLFTYLFEVGADISFNPNLKASVKVIDGGTEIFSGYAQMRKITVKREVIVGYELALFGEIGSIWKEMGDLLLSDLDLSDLNHEFNHANIVASWTAPIGEGYVYPLINDGNASFEDAVPEIPITAMKPAVYVKELWDKIFDTHGFQYESAFVSGTVFKSLIIPFTGDEPKRSVILTGTVSVTENGGGGAANVSITFSLRKHDAATNTDVDIAVDTVGLDGGTGDTGTVSLTGLTTVRGGDTMTINMAVNSGGSFSFQVTAANFSVTYLDNGVTGSIGDFNGVRTSGTQTVITTGDHGVAIPDELYDPGNVHSGASATVSAATVDFENFIIPNVKQRDFIISLLRMFNMYVDTDKDYQKRLLIEPYTDFFNANSEDWTEKVDIERGIELLPMAALNAKSYRFQYKPETGDFYNKLYTDEWKKNYGEYVYTVENDFLTAENKTELIFSPTPSRQSPSNNLIVPTIVKDDPNTAAIPNHVKSNIRILYYGGLIDGAWDFVSTGTTSLTTYPYSGHLDDPATPTLDILFGAPEEVYFLIDPDLYTLNNLFNVYHSQFMEEISNPKSKLMSCYLWLTPFDIQKLDFRKIYKLLGYNWRLYEVSDYKTNQNDLTKCTFLYVKTGTTWVSRSGKPGLNVKVYEKQLVVDGGLDSVYDLFAEIQGLVYSGGENAVLDIGDISPPIELNGSSI